MCPYRNVGFSEYNPTQGNQIPKLGLRSALSNAINTRKIQNSRLSCSKVVNDQLSTGVYVGVVTLSNSPYKQDRTTWQGMHFSATLLLLYRTSDIWRNQQNLPKLQVTVYLFILYLSFIALQPANETCKWFAIVNPQGWDPWPQTKSSF